VRKAFRLVAVVAGVLALATAVLSSGAPMPPAGAGDGLAPDLLPFELPFGIPPRGRCAGDGEAQAASACWRPYADQSPFNRRLPASPRLHPDSVGIVRRLVSFGPPGHIVAGEADTKDDFAHPTYYSASGDPVFTVHCLEDWGRCDVEGHRVAIPDAARPAAGGDGHLTVVDRASGWEYDFWQVRRKPRGGGTIEISWGGRTPIDGDGLGSDATASRFGNLAGIIRAPELEAGDIDHALFMVVECDAEQQVYPALKGGSHCGDQRDAVPMGARFQLDMPEAEIDALRVPAWKKTILRAMARYGMYVGDTGGGTWGIQAESGSTYTSFGREDRLVTFARRVRAPRRNGRFVFDLRHGVNWERHLRVIDPCEAQARC
jgi:hypothetical protein